MEFKLELVVLPVSDVDRGGAFGPEGQTPGVHPDRSDYGTYLSFSDPDGNGWLVQEVGHTA